MAGITSGAISSTPTKTSFEKSKTLVSFETDFLFKET
jgi:hypothetical protein